MEPSNKTTTRAIRVLLFGLLVVAAVTRLYQFRGPLLDRLYVKQIYVANLARHIAGPPWNPLRCRFDFLDEAGKPMELFEEVPLYTALVGASYQCFGEQEWIGRAWNLAATLIAILGIYDLMRQEYDARTGFAAASLFAMTPLAIFYGRAVLPDPCMMACMVWSAAYLRRYLDQGEPIRWLAATAVTGLLAGAFKYYGLMIVLPLADMAYRRGGWRYWFKPRFLALISTIVLPIACWIVAVFFQHPNPTSRTQYLFWQDPGALVNVHLYNRLTFGLFVKDCGLVTAVLISLGALAALKGKETSRPLWGWSAMGLFFWFLFAPKMLEHDYYELVFLPGLVGWAAVGWRALTRLASQWHRNPIWAGGFTLVLAAVIQSPLFAHGKYDMEIGHLVVAERIKQVCPGGGRIIVMGQRFGWPMVHYSGRQGWVEQFPSLPTDWRDLIDKYRRMGAACVALYFDPTVPESSRKSYGPLLASLPIAEHGTGPWFTRGRPCEYYLLRLQGPTGETPAAALAVTRRERR